MANQPTSISTGLIGRLHSSLQITFTHSVTDFSSVSLQEVATEWTGPHLDNLALPLPLLSKPAVPLEGVQRHSFVLDLGAASTAPRSTVYIRLLGPFSARAGEVVTFCWRLQRSKGFAAEQESEILPYEIRVEVKFTANFLHHALRVLRL